MTTFQVLNGERQFITQDLLPIEDEQPGLFCECWVFVDPSREYWSGFERPGLIRVDVGYAFGDIVDLRRYFGGAFLGMLGPAYFLAFSSRGQDRFLTQRGKVFYPLSLAELPEPLRARAFVPLRRPVIDPFTGEPRNLADGGPGFLPWRGPWP